MGDHNPLQKFFPYILIAGTLVLGAYILAQKGIVSLPSFGKKQNVVELSKKLVVDILFTGDEYKLSYTALDPASLVNIAKFDKSEQWQGEGSIDEDEQIGGNVISLIARDGKKISAFLFKPLHLATADNIKFAVNLKSDPEDIEGLNVIFGDKDLTNYFRFPLTNLVPGINYLSVPKYRFSLTEETVKNGATSSVTGTAAKSTLTWDKIERIQLELASRPGSKANVEVGWLRGEKEDVFEADWNFDGTAHFLNLDTDKDGKLVLLVNHVGKGTATLRKLGSVSDFTYSARITSLIKGNVGLFFRGDYKSAFGYYLAVGGVDTNDWSLSKLHLDQDQAKNSVLASGQIGNFEFSVDQPFYLKITAKGSKITGYFSLDGKEYTKLEEVVDNTFSAGGVGIAIAGGASAYVDDFNLIQK